ncbi:MAG: Hsp20/alpha crystallin family protein [Planctomycetota bacterium]|nr:Hsp20/alpha crystallin family protein [Planctomycetota bacterium]
MAQKRPGGKAPEELAARIRQLEETVRRLREGGGPADTPATGPQGLAEGLVAALGKMVPGLGDLIQTAARSSEFHERLFAIDEEVKRKFKDYPVRGISVGAARRQMGIPPSVRHGRTGRGQPTAGGEGHVYHKARGKGGGVRPPKMHITPETPAQFAVDVFDEGDQIVVLAEAPGIDLANVTVSLEDTVLVIHVEGPDRRADQRIELPCEVSGEPEATLANAILNIHVKKAKTR